MRFYPVNADLSRPRRICLSVFRRAWPPRWRTPRGKSPSDA